MPTQAQINANRLNAQKSTGPTSPGSIPNSWLTVEVGYYMFRNILNADGTGEAQPLTHESHAATHASSHAFC